MTTSIPRREKRKGNSHPVGRVVRLSEAGGKKGVPTREGRRSFGRKKGGGEVPYIREKRHYFSLGVKGKEKIYYYLL